MSEIAATSWINNCELRLLSWNFLQQEASFCNLLTRIQQWSMKIEHFHFNNLSFLLDGNKLVFSFIVSKCLANNKNDSSFWLQSCRSFLYSIIISIPSRLVVTQSIMLCFPWINVVSTSSNDSMHFVFIKCSVVHGGIDAHPLYLWLVGVYFRFSYITWLKKFWKLSLSFCCTVYLDGDDHHKFHLYTP